MAYHETIDLYVETDRNRADVLNSPIEKLIQNVTDNRKLIKSIEATVDKTDKRFDEYTKTDELNVLLEHGIKGDKGDKGEKGDKGDPGDVSLGQLNSVKDRVEQLQRELNQLQVELDSINLDWSAISNKPTSFPANGGNADTVDGKHASDFALVNHNHNNYQDKLDKNLNQINIDTTRGNWVSAVTRDGIRGTMPPTGSWYNIYQIDSSHFLSQLAIGCDSHRVYTRYKYSSDTTWKAWQLVYTANFKPTCSDIGAALSNHDHNNLYALKSHEHSNYLSNLGGDITGRIRQIVGNSYKEPTGNWAMKVINGIDSGNENGLHVATRWGNDNVDIFRCSKMWTTGVVEEPVFRIKGLGSVWASGNLEVVGTIISRGMNLTNEINSLKTKVEGTLKSEYIYKQGGLNAGQTFTDSGYSGYIYIRTMNIRHSVQVDSMEVGLSNFVVYENKYSDGGTSGYNYKIPFKNTFTIRNNHDVSQSYNQLSYSITRTS